ncbi:MAG: glutamine--fructose-6-phosphate transaminase (isomerizing) [Patescibacteria group bacterium]
MCGIFGIVTNQEKNLGQILVKCGKRLSYRGYDSVGAATFSSKGIDLRKSVGKIEEVSKKLKFSQMRGDRGIIQLRWATFGAPSRRNAQPHFGCQQDLVGAHNGNIINHIQLREKFLKEGHLVRSTNDGETCVHAVDQYLKQGKTMIEAIRLAYKDLEGDYAFIIGKKDERKLYAIKKGSTLVAGFGQDFTCCSSDLPSILPLTNKIFRIKDNEILILSPEEIEIRSVLSGKKINRQPEIYKGNLATAEKGDFPHFMFKEIAEEPQVAADLLGLLKKSIYLRKFIDILKKSDKIFFVGCGSSYHACLTGAYYFNKIARRCILTAFGPELIENYGQLIDKKTAIVFVSQSGETKDILKAVKPAKKKGAKILAILNVIGSTLMYEADIYLPLNCGYEIAVPATKTFLNQLIIFLYLAKKMVNQSTHYLEKIPTFLEKIFKETNQPAEKLAEKLVKKFDMYYLGYGVTYGVALEGALKLKEITYTHAEGILSSEFKHGPLSAVYRDYPVVFIAAKQDIPLMINHINEVSCRGGRTIVIAPNSKILKKYVHDYLFLPNSDHYLIPIFATIPLQLIAYHLSVKRGIDPDFPRNLSKTITVD